MAKRAFDIIFSIIGIIVTLPILIMVALIIKTDSPGPVIFKQERVGKGGKLFKIKKFRTMRTDSEKGGLLTVGADSRVTKIGAILRKTKADELPQLFNVLCGDMSFVGPRPEVPKFMCMYPPTVKEKILSVRPGITDRAAIEMIDENEILSKYDDPKQGYIDEIMPIKSKYYLAYVEKNNFFDDIKIIIMTLAKILSR